MLTSRWRARAQACRCAVGAAALVVAVVGPLAHGADYAREDRWAQEVAPSLVVGDAVWLTTPARPKVFAILTEPTGTAKGAVVVVHGLGVHPDFGVIGGLRTGLADAGFTTLSVQMPVLAADAPRDDYRATFPEAGDRIAAAIAQLRARGAAHVAVVAHSMGAAMANAYLARPDATPIDAWAPVGMFGDFAVAPREPVLDVLAQSEIPPVRETAPARMPRLPKDGCSRQLTVEGADHYFESRQKELVAVLVAFLERAFAGRCAIAG